MQSTEAPEDVSILRDLAKRYAEIAFLPVHREKARLWRQLNGLERIRPLVLVYGPTDIENACVCKWDWARGFERHLRSQIWYWDHARDDRVWNDVIYGPAIFSQTGGLIGLLSTSGKFVPSDCPDGAGRYEAALNGTEDPEALVRPPC